MQVSEKPDWLDQITYNEQGLIPVVTQDAATGDVLMLAWMNSTSILQTLNTGKATYWSRSRQALWIKGETSGHTQAFKELLLDCDGDSLLMLVEQTGVACHTGRANCFYKRLTLGSQTEAHEVVAEPKASYGQNAPALPSREAANRGAASRCESDQVLAHLSSVIDSRKSGDAGSSYVASLHHKGLDQMLKKVIEEAGEVLMAAKDAKHGLSSNMVVNETADLWFHSLVVLSRFDLTSIDVIQELARRFGTSGIDEKNSRAQISAASNSH